MVNEVSQWLAEIQTLQQQLGVLSQERDQAYASAANWRRLYESESEQRRNDAERSQTRIRVLANELDNLKQSPADGEVSRDLQKALAQVKQLESLDELRSQLTQSLTRCAQLSSALKAEQIAHEETRQSLTTALGDTIDLLAKDQTSQSDESLDSAE